MAKRKSKKDWRNWGDHPFIVVCGTLAALVTIIAFITGKESLLKQNHSKPEFRLSTSTLHPDSTLQIFSTSAFAKTQRRLIVKLDQVDISCVDLISSGQWQIRFRPCGGVPRDIFSDGEHILKLRLVEVEQEWDEYKIVFNSPGTKSSKKVFKLWRE